MRARKVQLAIVGGLLLLVVGAFIFQRAQREASAPIRTAEEVSAAAIPVPAPSTPLPLEPLIGERILAYYGDPARPPEEDLTWMARALENFALLVKGDNPLPLGANEEIAAALRGKNRAHLRALPDRHPALNEQGQLVDRWGTPLFFHARSRDRLDIRSAGPDRQMWTADDLHRQPNGRFLRGEALLAPSLFDETAEIR